MGAYNYKELRRHVGHKVAVVYYGPEHEYEGDPANVSVECEDCNEVLFDYDKPEDPDEEAK